MNSCCTRHRPTHGTHTLVLISFFSMVFVHVRIGKCALQRFQNASKRMRNNNKWKCTVGTHGVSYTRKNYNLFRLFILYIALVQYVSISIYISIWISCKRKNDTKSFGNLYSYRTKCASVKERNVNTFRRMKINVKSNQLMHKIQFYYKNEMYIF